MESLMAFFYNSPAVMGKESKVHLLQFCVFKATDFNTKSYLPKIKPTFRNLGWKK